MSHASFVPRASQRGPSLAAFGPFEAFNLHRTWLLVVLISGLGFLGYIAMRSLGASAGLVVTALFGGLASSTATTLAFSRRSKSESAFSEYYALAVVIACCVMLARVVIEVGVLNVELALTLVGPFALMALPGVSYGVWLWFRRQPGKGTVNTPQISNPLSLKTAIKFALLYACIAFLVKAFTHFDLLRSSLLPLSFFSGLTDMDAISLSVTGNHTSGAVPLHLATQAIIIAAVSNSLVKAGIAITLGSPVMRKQIALVLGLTAAAAHSVLVGVKPEHSSLVVVEQVTRLTIQFAAQRFERTEPDGPGLVGFQDGEVGQGNPHAAGEGGQTDAPLFHHLLQFQFDRHALRP